MSRDDPRRRDWWLVGCGVIAVALAASTTVVILSDEGWARSAFVAPGTPAASPSPSYLLSRTTEEVPSAQPDTSATPGPTRAR